MHRRIGSAIFVGAMGVSFAGHAAAPAPQPPVEARVVGMRSLWLDFAEPMQAWANEVRRDAVRITPVLLNTCTWDSDTRLACALGAVGAVEATRYRVDIAGGLKTQAGVVLPGRTLFVDTPRPQLSASIAAWRDGIPDLEIEANMPVTAAAARSALRLSINGAAVEVPPLHALPPRWSGDKSARFALAPLRADASDHVLKLGIVPGLRATGPLAGTQDESLLSARVNERFALRGVECPDRNGRVTARPTAAGVAATCLPGEVIQLVFPRPLDAASRLRFARNLPVGVRLLDWKPKDAGRRGSDRGTAILTAPPHWVELEMAAAYTAVTLTLDASLIADNGAALEPVTVQLRSGAARPRLHAAHAHSLIADGRQLPALVEARNAGAVFLDVRGVGAGPREETLRTPEHRDSTLRALTSAATAETLAEGGWVRWTPAADGAATTNRYSQPQPIDFAAPAFDLFAVAGRREVLAWANEWERDAAVAGAEVELLWRETVQALPTVVARARTGDDGVALLRLPDDIAVPKLDDGAPDGPQWLLRAAQGSRRGAARAVLPLGEPQAWGLELGKALPRKTWGVSDRPMYRAGDTVRYRLWQRRVDGGHLRAADRVSTVAMQLSDENREKVVLEWSAASAADGGIAGELVLPVHLTDATYCIGVQGESDETEGTCFFVGTYRAQDLWAEVKTAGGVLRDGDRFAVELKAGYYSGGPAAGVDVDRAEVTLEAMSIEEAYPQFASYRFVDVYGGDIGSPEVKGVGGKHALDPDGALRINVPLVFDGTAAELAHRPAFGRLLVDVEASPADREGTTAADEATRYARFRRYVGLKLDPAWFDATTPVQAAAIVIDAQGRVVADAVDVEIDYLPGFDAAGGAPQRLAHCVLRATAPAPCDFPRAKSGRYRLTARSGDAAPAELVRYVWTGDGVLRGAVDATELTLLDGSPHRDAPLRVLLKQPHTRARVLFVFGSGSAILGHRVEAATGNMQGYALPISPQWRAALQLNAYVRETAPLPKDGYRIPSDITALDVFIAAAETGSVAEPVNVQFAPGIATPGGAVQVTVSNHSAQARDVVLAVMDDALRSLAQRWLDYADPMGSQWLGALQRPSGRLRGIGFDDWNDAPWNLLLPWPRDVAGVAGPLPDAGGKPALPADPEEPPVIVDDPSPVDAPAPASGRVVADSLLESNGGTTLDRIQVTGSRIRRVDLENSAPVLQVDREGLKARLAKAPDSALNPPDGDTRDAAHVQRELALVRTRFADTALWLPDIHLAPGESRTIELKLPDNLTRWRAVAWSGDSGEDFAMAQAALETGLPVEVRLQTPVRIYPGDRARLATNVRQTGGDAVVARIGLKVEGIGMASEDAQPLPLAARGQGSVATTIAPDAVGLLQITATAETPAGRDAVAAPVEVASPLIAVRKVQAGWLGAAPLVLDLPPLPASAQDAQLQVALLRGDAGLVGRWSEDLRDYPHRCWEQILSRAVAAALALERRDSSWPDAQVVVQEALTNAAVFQDGNGGFRYFVDGIDTYGPSPESSVALSAYTVRAFALLRELGYPVPARIDADAREYLAQIAPTATDRRARDMNEPLATAPQNAAALARFAFAAAARDGVARAQLDTLWSGWDGLPLPAQIAAVRALANGQHPGAVAAMTRLLAAAPARGPTRVLRLPQRYDQWMSSDLREQCGLIALLRDTPGLAEPGTRRALIAGLTDLYAGGVTSVDTQSGVTCLMALRDLEGGHDGAVASARIEVGAASTQLRLAPGDRRVDWHAGAPAAPRLRIQALAGADVSMSFVAELRYLEDARVSRASAVGFSIERHYAVLRDRVWRPVAAQTLREGDWIRISLAIQTSAPRQFVAVTDAVPGGLRPTDLSLAGIAGTDLARVSDEGSGAFTTRKLDPRSPRFYAQTLPAGRHDLHYFARVGNAGDYLAAPATAELMYGSATTARTAATRLLIEPAVE